MNIESISLPNLLLVKRYDETECDNCESGNNCTLFLMLFKNVTYYEKMEKIVAKEIYQ